MDPSDANHLIAGGSRHRGDDQGRRHDLRRGPRSTTSAPEAPGRRGGASSAADDPGNQMSAVDVKLTVKVPGNWRRPARRPRDFAHTGGENTLPGGQELATGAPIDPLAGTFPPGTTGYTPFTIGPGKRPRLGPLINVKG